MNSQIPDEVRQQVLIEIEKLEKIGDIKVLLAVESGSRAWGFASHDSDYDVRIIYMHRPEWYWHLENAAEPIEHESNGAINIPITGDLDIAGWDLRKTLGLLHKSNPPLFEWLRSPIVYCKDDATSQELLDLSNKFYSPKSATYHYLHMAEGNFRQYLINREAVKHKKYLYVIRPVLACIWIDEYGSFPPMEIDKTLHLLDERSDPSAKESIAALLEEKRAGTELGEGPAIKPLEDFLRIEIDRINKKISSLPEHGQKLTDLNAYFRMKLRG